LATLDHSAKLDPSARLVALQFSFSNPKAIPSSIKSAVAEMPEDMRDRASSSNGKLVIEPTSNCSLIVFFEHLEAEGYEMVDAFSQRRIDRKSEGKRAFYIVRFLFARHEFADVSDAFKRIRENMREEFQSMCDSAFWRVRVFSNPFFKDGVEIPGARFISINLEAREPRLHPDGELVLARRKDESGRRVGEPIPLEADYDLGVLGDSIALVAA